MGGAGAGATLGAASRPVLVPQLLLPSREGAGTQGCRGQGAACAFAWGARSALWGPQVTAAAPTQGSRVAVGTRGAGAPLPLPPSSPPAAGRAPVAGLGSQSQEGRRGRAPPTRSTPRARHLLPRRKQPRRVTGSDGP